MGLAPALVSPFIAELEGVVDRRFAFMLVETFASPERSMLLSPLAVDVWRLISYVDTLPEAAVAPPEKAKPPACILFVSRGDGYGSYSVIQQLF